jgi:murein DD-endopeptidase MepM/ murein hydrolase activator NlpD
VDSVAELVALVLLMVVFVNWRNGTLGEWVRAKFFNAAAPKPEEPSIAERFGEWVSDFFSGGTIPKEGGPFVPKPDVGPTPAVGRLLDPLPGHPPPTAGGSFGNDRGDHIHAGVDLYAATGTPIRAAAAGKATYVGNSGDCGLRVELDHGGGLLTRYCHMSRTDTKLGQSFAAGATIGYVGTTGNASGPHLHFEVRVNGVATDPMRWIG